MNKNKNKKLIGILIILATVAVLGLVLVQKFTPPEEPVLSVVSEKRDFKVDEDTEFKFRYVKAERELVGSIQEALNLSDFWEEINIEAEIEDSKGKSLHMSPEIFLGNNGEFSVRLKKPQVLKPGVYKMLVKIEDESGESIKVQELEQEFSWGVLAINANKSIYLSSEALAKEGLPAEQAYIQMAVLDSEGHTICDARLELRIKNEESRIKNQESGEETVLSTEDGTIKKSSECGPKSITDVPDYFAYYQVGEVGNYQITLTNLAAGYKITDSFEVRESVPFDVERIGPTRIYPPADYEVILKIKPNQDFAGQVEESVPATFSILEVEGGEYQINNGSVKQIIWKVNWKAGQVYELSYVFNALNISPYLYLLGPLIFSQ